MAVALRAGTAAAENSSTPALPTVVVGDLILLWHHSSTGPAPTVAGYTQAGTWQDGNSSSRTTVFYRIATGSDSITITGGGPNFVTYISSYSGVNPTTPIDGLASSTSLNAVTPTAPSVTASRPGGYLICGLGGAPYGGVGPVTWTPPAGLTERIDYSGTDSSYPYANTVASAGLASSGATGTQTFTCSYSGGAGYIVAVSLVLAPTQTIPYVPAVML